MIVRGNSKLGKTIWSFSIPASETCPGKTSLCDSNCYAQAGYYRFNNMKKGLKEKYEATLKSDFVEKISTSIKQKKVKYFRIHVAGDFYSAEYTSKWYNIVSLCNDTKFIVYTRSWRIEKINE